jgi:cell division protein FtsW
MMLIGRVPWKQIGRLVGIVGVSLTLLVSVIVLIPPKAYQNIPGTHRFATWQSRIKGFFEDKGEIPAAKFDIDKDAQVAHANIAIATSHIVGKMPGNSVQRDFLSQAFSDFIFAIVIEELGLLGGGFIVMLYLWLLIRAGRIAKRSDKHFPAFLVMGIALLLVSQAMLNMMVAVGLFPVTGQPLPLISKGGTSTLINCAYIGMILSVSRYVAEKEEQRRQMELQNNENELQAAAQALVIQAKKMANAETEEYEDIAMEVPQTLNPASDNIKEQNNS